MPIESDVNSFYIPEFEDSPRNIELPVSFARDLDKRAVPRFATTAVRSTSIPIPEEGQVAAIQGVAAGMLQCYNGAGWGSFHPKAVFKSASTARTNNTVSADPHLTVTVEKKTHYYSYFFLQVTGGTAGDFRVGLTFDSHRHNIIHFRRSEAAGARFLSSGPIIQGEQETIECAGTTFSTQSSWVIGEGVFYTGVETSGSIEWAQVTTNATATTVFNNSIWIIQKLP